MVPDLQCLYKGHGKWDQRNVVDKLDAIRDKPRQADDSWYEDINSKMSLRVFWRSAIPENALVLRWYQRRRDGEKGRVFLHNLCFQMIDIYTPGDHRPDQDIEILRVVLLSKKRR